MRLEASVRVIGLLVFVALPSAVFARTGLDGGIGSSGGGMSVVCRAADHSIESAELLDIYEARENGANIRQPVGDDSQEYKIFLEHARHSTNDRTPVTSDDIAKFHAFIKKAYNFIPMGQELPTTCDSGGFAPIKPGCAIEQLAVFHDDTNKIDINSEIYSRLDSLNRVALYAHELFYRLYRLSGDNTSLLSRRLVGLFFNQEYPQQILEGVPTDIATQCFAQAKDSKLGSDFYFFPDPRKPGHTILQFVRLLGRDTMSPVKISIEQIISSDKFELSEGDGRSTYVKVNDPNASYVRRHMIHEGVFAGYSISVQFQFNQPFGVSLISPEGETLNHHRVRLCVAP